jgi:TolB-like protein/Flp pilus assembly protein TadD
VAAARAAGLPFPHVAGQPAPRRRRVPALAWIAAAALAVAVVAALVWRGGGLPAGGPAGEIRSIAVLPLDNVSGDAGQDYLADGMTEELIAMLARVTPLQVISRTSVMRYRDTDKTLRQIARELRVDAVVEGTVLRAGDRVRVTAQLIDAARDRHLWSRSFERPVEDVLTLQMDIAREIVGELHAVLLPATPQTRPGRVDPGTWEATMRGRHHIARRTVTDLHEAVNQFQLALDRSPNDAGAWAGLATAHALLHSYGVGKGIDHLLLAEQAADRAVALDSGSADAQTAHGQVSVMLWQWDDAERSLRRALEIQPNHTDGHYWYSEFLLEQGRLEEALAHIDLAVRGDPLSQTCTTRRAEVLVALGRYDQAEDEIERTLRFDPSYGRIYLEKLDLMHIQGKLAEAAQAIIVMDSLSGVSTEHARKLLHALDRGGPQAYWNEASRQLLAAEGNRVAPAWWVAYCLTLAGREDEAFEWLSRSLDRRENPGLVWRWSWESLRDDLRYAALLERTGLGRPAS